jgi:rhodanese-related sulfurtransferase
MMKLNTLTVLLLLLFAAFAQAEVIEIDNARLQELLAEKVPVVDIRRAEEWAQTGIVEGSHLLTFFDANGNYDAHSWLAQLEQIAGAEEPVILICRTGRRTGLVSKFMSEQVGYQQVYNVSKGIRDWIDSGNPTAKPQ